LQRASARFNRARCETPNSAGPPEFFTLISGHAAWRSSLLFLWIPERLENYFIQPGNLLVSIFKNINERQTDGPRIETEYQLLEPGSVSAPQLN
jgi:hypothetical protein